MLKNTERTIMLKNNRNELLKKWHEKPKEQKPMQKRTENTASGGISTREYSPIYTYWYKIHQYFLQSMTNAIQPLAQRPCTNCRELPNFIREVSCSF